MNDRLRESLSALMDDEANELEFERILANVGSNEELRETWSRYNLARHVAEGHEVSLTGMDISRRVSAAIAEEALPEVAEESPSLGERLLKPLVSFGVAASVASAVLIGGPQLAGVSGEDGNFSVVSNPPSPVYMESIGAVPVPANMGTQPVAISQHAAETLYRRLAEERMNKHMQEHAGHAAMNTPHGLLTYARVPVIQGQPELEPAPAQSLEQAAGEAPEQSPEN